MRTFKVRKWVAECLSRCFPWFHFGARRPITRPAPARAQQRGLLGLMQFESRESPTSLSVLGSAWMDGASMLWGGGDNRHSAAHIRTVDELRMRAS